MGKIQLTEREKELLTALGNYPHIPMKELLNRTQYKWVSTVIRKIEQLKKQDMLLGPFYDIDYGKLCKNPIHRVHCIVKFSQYETVISYLTLIESLRWMYPVLSPRKELLNVAFLSSNDAEVKALLKLLKDNNIITDYTVRIGCHKRIRENPNFFGEFNPSLDNLLEPCDIPDLFFWMP